MLSEIHSGEKCNAPSQNVRSKGMDAFLDTFSRLPKLSKAILRYTSNQDLESLMWVALWIVFGLVNWEKAKKIRPQIFAGSLYLTRMRRIFFTTENSVFLAEFEDAFHPGLRSQFPGIFELIRGELYDLLSPRVRGRELSLFNNICPAFGQFVVAIIDTVETMSMVVQYGSRMLR